MWISRRKACGCLGSAAVAMAVVPEGALLDTDGGLVGGGLEPRPEPEPEPERGPDGLEETDVETGKSGTGFARRSWLAWDLRKG